MGHLRSRPRFVLQNVTPAAYELGISETAVRQHLSGLYRRTGCVNAAQAAHWLGIGERDSRALTGVGGVESATAVGVASAVTTVGRAL